jgi:hypothetical protein
MRSEGVYTGLSLTVEFRFSRALAWENLRARKQKINQELGQRSARPKCGLLDSA